MLQYVPVDLQGSIIFQEIITQMLDHFNEMK